MFLLVDWTVVTSPKEGDNCTVFTLYTSNWYGSEETGNTKSWSHRRANWNDLANHHVWKSLPEYTEQMTCGELIADTYDRSNKAALDTMTKCKRWYFLNV